MVSHVFKFNSLLIPLLPTTRSERLRFIQKSEESGDYFFSQQQPFCKDTRKYFVHCRVDLISMLSSSVIYDPALKLRSVPYVVFLPWHRGFGTSEANSLCNSNTPPMGVSFRRLLKPTPARALTSITGNADGSRIKKSESCFLTITTRRARSVCWTRSHLVKTI